MAWVKIANVKGSKGDQGTPGTFVDGVFTPITAEVAWGVVDAVKRLGWNAVGADGGPMAHGVTAIREAGLGKPRTTLTVKTDGTGNFLSPKLANDFVLGMAPSLGNDFEILVYPGVYTEIEWTIAPYTTIRAKRRGTVELRGAVGNDRPDTEVNTWSTVWMVPTSRLVDITVTARNMRYAIHCDNSGLNTNSVISTEGCTLIHYGNQDAIDWRTANPGSGLLPATVWRDPPAWGAGAASGQRMVHVNTTMKSLGHPIAIHNNKDFATPTLQRIDGGTYFGDNARAFLVASLGSGSADRIDIRNANFSGLYIQDDDLPWISTALENQYARHADFAITVAGGSVLGYRSTSRGLGLKVTSASTGATSTVRLTGTAVPYIVGTVTNQDGGGGLQGYAYGALDISGILVGSASNIAVNNTLGKRLGNRTGSAVDLTITTEAGAATVTFNADHTAQTNATILASINAALGALGTAAEHNVAVEEFYPQMLDRQFVAKNSSAVGIPRWAAVTFDTSPQAVKLAPTNMAVADFVGIALEPIPPGKSGRILTEGVLLTNQVFGSVGFPAYGASLYLSDVTAGAIATSGTRTFGRGAGSNLTYFKANRRY